MEEALVLAAVRALLAHDHEVAAGDAVRAVGPSGDGPLFPNRVPRELGQFDPVVDDDQSIRVLVMVLGRDSRAAVGVVAELAQHRPLGEWHAVVPLPGREIIRHVLGPAEIGGLAGNIVELEGRLEERRPRLLVDAVRVEGPGRRKAVLEELVDVEGEGLLGASEIRGLVGGPEGRDERRDEEGPDRALGIDGLAGVRPGLADASVGGHGLEGEIAHAEGRVAVLRFPLPASRREVEGLEIALGRLAEIAGVLDLALGVLEPDQIIVMAAEEAVRQARVLEPDVEALQPLVERAALVREQVVVEHRVRERDVLPGPADLVFPGLPLDPALLLRIPGEADRKALESLLLRPEVVGGELRPHLPELLGLEAGLDRLGVEGPGRVDEGVPAVPRRLHAGDDDPGLELDRLAAGDAQVAPVGGLIGVAHGVDLRCLFFGPDEPVNSLVRQRLERARESADELPRGAEEADRPGLGLGIGRAGDRGSVIGEGPGLAVLDEALGLEPLAPGVAVVHHRRNEAVARRVKRLDLHGQARRMDVVVAVVVEGPGPLEDAGIDLPYAVGDREAFVGERHEPGDLAAAGGEHRRGAGLTRFDPVLGRGDGGGGKKHENERAQSFGHGGSGIPEPP